MKIMRVATADGPCIMRIEDDQLHPLAAPGVELRDLIVSGCRLESGHRSAESLGPMAPLIPGKIVAVGLNYRDHVQEAGGDEPATPLLFTKFPSSVIGDAEPIMFDPNLAERVDWEVELAVVIGRTTKHVATANALDQVFGYAVANDVSARDIQFRDGQWVRGKSLDTFCPLGPCVVTADELPDPQSLALGTRVNGVTKQSSSTSKMIFSVAELIAFCSDFFTLEAGDVLLTGTPWGCGEFANPRESLKDGDVVEVWIQGIGTMTNPVVTSTRGGSSTLER